MTSAELAEAWAADQVGAATDGQRAALYELADEAGRCPALSFVPRCPVCRRCSRGKGERPGEPTLRECLTCVVGSS